jgi:DnaK suppressor protein
MQSFPSEVLDEVKKHLRIEQTEIAKRIEEVSHQDPFTEERANDADNGTEADETSTHDRFAAMTDELKMKQNAIRSALHRIDEGTYGFCEECENMIDTDRLGIIPTATLCLSCEQKKKK